MLAEGKRREGAVRSPQWGSRVPTLHSTAAHGADVLIPEALIASEEGGRVVEVRPCLSPVFLGL